MVWRDLVDMVAHASRHLFRGATSREGFPTLWKGDGRVIDRQLCMIWEPLKYPIELDTVFRTGLLKPAYESVW